MDEEKEDLKTEQELAFFINHLILRRKSSKSPCP